MLKLPQTTVTYEELIRLSRQLYDDLKNTSTSDLLNLNKFAFSLAGGLEFEDVMIWDSNLLTSLQSHINLYKPQVLQMLDLLLPMLAQGWFTQRGNVFGFGDYDPASSKLVTKMNWEKLKVAPINKLDPERSVGEINYRLGIYGRSELKAASSSYVKGKNSDLIELKPPGEYQKYQKKVQTVNSLVQKWN